MREIASVINQHALKQSLANYPHLRRMDISAIYHGWLATQSITLDHIDRLPPTWPIREGGVTLERLPALSRPKLGILAEGIFESHLRGVGHGTVHRGVQIMQAGRTLGELDFITRAPDGTWHHIEVAYKIYLYLGGRTSDEMSCLIGPNQSDSLRNKVDRLINRQVPLLYHPATIIQLTSMGVPPASITQWLSLKAQVYHPEHISPAEVPPVALRAVCGVYYTLDQWIQNTHADDRIYLPPKLEWLSAPHDEVHWLTKAESMMRISELLDKRQSTLYWRMTSDSEIMRGLVVWW